MWANRMPADKLAELEPGAQVLVEQSRDGWTRTEIHIGKVVKVTPKQLVVHYPGYNGTIEARFRRDDAQKIGSGRGELLDPEHPTTVRDLAVRNREKRQKAIDNLADRWARERDNLDLLRRLQVAIGEYLDGEET